MNFGNAAQGGSSLGSVPACTQHLRFSNLSMLPERLRNLNAEDLFSVVWESDPALGPVRNGKRVDLSESFRCKTCPAREIATSPNTLKSAQTIVCISMRPHACQLPNVVQLMSLANLQTFPVVRARRQIAAADSILQH